MFHRYRFMANLDDPRPVTCPPPGPFWITGQTSMWEPEDFSIVVAYCHSREELLRFWPDATSIEDLGENQVRFSSRFPRPEWWQAEVS